MFEAIRNDNKRFRMLIIFILCLGSTASCGVPYLIRSFYSIYQDSVGLTNGQMGMLMTMYGLGGLFLYFPGGYLTDRFSPKKLIVTSYIASGILSLIMFTRPAYTVMLGLYIAYAITSIMMQWAAETKIVRVLGEENEQGRIYGYREALAGLGGMSVGLIVLYIGSLMGSEDATLNILVMSYSLIGIGCAILLALMLDNRSENTSSEKVDLSVIPKVLKIKQVWLVAFLVFVAYTMYSSLSYFSPYMEDVYGMSNEGGAVFGTIRQFGVRIFMCTLLGLLADRMGSAVSLLKICLGIVALHMLAYLVIPQSPEYFYVSLILMITVTCLAAGMRALYYSQFAECGFPVSLTGTIIGVVALVGYTPDTFFYTMVGYWIDTYGVAGYNYLFIFCASLAVAGVIAAMVLLHINKKSNKEIDNTSFDAQATAS